MAPPFPETPLPRLLQEHIQQALHTAASAPDSSKSDKDEPAGRLHARRSTNWVCALTKALRVHAQQSLPPDGIVAFCRSNGENRGAFQMNELLFDILVAQTRVVDAAVKTVNDEKKSLTAITKALWVVESELKQTNSRDVLIDLNKLVIAQAENKMLVISGSATPREWTMALMEQLLCPTPSNIFLVTIPHPKGWEKSTPLLATVYQWTAPGVWTRLASPTSRDGAEGGAPIAPGAVQEPQLTQACY